ncbi:MAG: hypothetical protein ACXIUM_10880 [Wenzhouxiangella sp.]
MNPNDRLDKRPVFKGFLAACVMFAGLGMASFAPPASASGTPGFEPFMQAAGEWLLGQQRPNGSFPNSAGDPPTLTFASVQSPSGLGMLSSWVATDDPDFLASAIAAGDFLLNGGFRLFPNTGEPEIRTFDPLFFIRLSAATGDPAYADFITDNFWAPLAAGTYGPNGDWDIADYVAAEIARRASVGSAAAAWDLSLIVAAAEEAGVTGFRTALAAGAAQALGFAPDTDYILGSRGFDLLGLAGAVWIGALTGESVTPASGQWAGLSLNGLANALLTFQAQGGSFLQSSAAFSSPVDVGQTTSQNTSFALLALSTLDEQQFFPQIVSGLNSLINDFQTPGGRISYFHPEADLGAAGDTKPFPYVHAYILFSVNETRDPEPFVPVPVPMFGLGGLALLLLTMLSLGWVAIIRR